MNPEKQLTKTEKLFLQNAYKDYYYPWEFGYILEREFPKRENKEQALTISYIGNEYMKSTLKISIVFRDKFELHKFSVHSGTELNEIEDIYLKIKKLYNESTNTFTPKTETVSYLIELFELKVENGHVPDENLLSLAKELQGDE